VPHTLQGRVGYAARGRASRFALFEDEMAPGPVYQPFYLLRFTSPVDEGEDLGDGLEQIRRNFLIDLHTAV
jgi:hypothetical protein